MKNKKQIILIAVLISIVSFFGFKVISQAQKDTTVFKNKQECSQYYELAKTKITDSGRVFQNDTYTINELFYSPKLNTCLFAYTINATFEPLHIYNIEDVFGGDVFTGSIQETFTEKISELKK